MSDTMLVNVRTDKNAFLRRIARNQNIGLRLKLAAGDDSLLLLPHLRDKKRLAMAKTELKQKAPQQVEPLSPTLAIMPAPISVADFAVFAADTGYDFPGFPDGGEALIVDDFRGGFIEWAQGAFARGRTIRQAAQLVLEQGPLADELMPDLMDPTLVTDGYPMPCLSVGDIQRYAKWLSDLTQSTWRMPSLSEYKNASATLDLFHQSWIKGKDRKKVNVEWTGTNENYFLGDVPTSQFVFHPLIREVETRSAYVQLNIPGLPLSDNRFFDTTGRLVVEGSFAT